MIVVDGIPFAGDIRESVRGVKEDFVQESQEAVLQYVVEDFNSAVANLKNDILQPGRIGKAVANHMLAYAHLCAMNYPEAEVAAQAAIDAPNHRLVTERFGSKAGHPNEVAYTGGTIRDHYMIRLAETYLILAEAQHRQGKNMEAAENINLVRQRAGASAISPEEINIDLILDEKTRELWGEQYSRKVDLFRTGKYHERVRLFNQEAGANVADKHRLLPIPQSEIDLNRNNELTQNPGW